eukprot:4941351-Ditylum_brightwellii.AAC.1
MWGLIGIKGWYIGPRFERYRCCKVYIPSTKGECITVTVNFHPQSSKLLHISAAEVATHAAKDLMVAIRDRHTNAPFSAMGDSQLMAIKQLADIFQQLSNGDSHEQSPRVKTLTKQAVGHNKNQPHNMPLARVQKSTPLPRLQKNNMPHLIPNDDNYYGNLPPPKLHPITIPTPKGGQFYIPPEDDDISPIHWYPTRN